MLFRQSGKIATEPDGKALMVADGSVVRLNADGSPDRTFEFEPSAQMTAIDPYYEIDDPVVLPDGRFAVFLNLAFGGDAPTVVVSYSASGSLDPTFGNAGEVYQPGDDQAYWLALQTDRKLLVLTAHN